MDGAKHGLRWRLPLLLALVAGTCGCADATAELALANPDRAAFDMNVYPILVRDCGFHECHGSSERFFQVFGPGHGRITPELVQPLDPTTAQEMEISYQRALSMIDTAAPESSPLLRKPLAVDAGGAGHQGVDRLARDVYQSTADSGYVVLLNWVLSQAAVGAPAAPAPGVGAPAPGTGQPQPQPQP